jgi:hydroxypyruvate reductase
MKDAQTPRVLSLLEGLGKPIEALGNGAFSTVGPWNCGGDWEQWLEAGGGKGIRIALSAGADKFDAQLFERLPDLEAVVVFGAGYDGLDVNIAKARGIVIDNAGWQHAGEVADHAVGMALALRRRLFDADRWVREGRWAEARIAPTHSMTTLRVGIVGLGNIGRAIAERLSAFETRVQWWGRSPQETPWERVADLKQLAAQNDMLIVAIAAHDGTRGLITREIIEALGPNGALINMSRGFVVDESALLAALKEGRLGQAGLDVFEAEPDDGKQWKDLPNVILSPHSSGHTIESFQILCKRSADAVIQHLAKPAR